MMATMPSAFFALNPSCQNAAPMRAVSATPAPCPHGVHESERQVVQGLRHQVERHQVPGDDADDGLFVLEAVRQLHHASANTSDTMAMPSSTYGVMGPPSSKRYRTPLRRPARRRPWNVASRYPKLCPKGRVNGGSREGHAKRPAVHRRSGESQRREREGAALLRARGRAAPRLREPRDGVPLLHDAPDGRAGRYRIVRAAGRSLARTVRLRVGSRRHGRVGAARSGARLGGEEATRNRGHPHDVGRVPRRIRSPKRMQVAPCARMGGSLVRGRSFRPRGRRTASTRDAMRKLRLGCTFGRGKSGSCRCSCRG